MRFTIGLALVAALAAASCKKKTADMSTTGSGSNAGSAPSGSAAAGSAGSGSAVQPAPAIDAAAGPWTVPAGATAGSADGDATALGTAVTAHLVERVPKPAAGEDHREVQLLLVLEGGGKTITADETNVSTQDGSPAVMALKTATDIVLPPLTPPRAFKDSDADQPLDFKGPLLFLVRFKAKAEDHVIAIGKDQDALVVWSLVIPSDSVDVAPEWEKTGTIKLAPGATVTGAGSGS